MSNNIAAISIQQHFRLLLATQKRLPAPMQYLEDDMDDDGDGDGGGKFML